jgi:ubiquinone/menaquinone biosynthesis C-methylase UbiE
MIVDQQDIAVAEFWEAHFVPAVLREWAVLTTDAAGIMPGQRILDAACGTGIAARVVADSIGSVGITGFDLNAGMTTVAQRLQPDANWVQADAQHVPFADGSFDVVLCQQSLMFFPKKVAALREMRRVMRSGGTIAISAAGASPGAEVMASILEESVGSAASTVFLSAFALREPNDVTSLFAAAGFTSANLHTSHTAWKYPSMEDCLFTHIGSFLVGCVDLEAILPMARGRLEPFCTASGAVHIPVDVHVCTASRD